MNVDVPGNTRTEVVAFGAMPQTSDLQTDVK